MAEQPHTDAFIAGIEAKIAAWKAVIDSYRAAKALEGGLPEAAANGQHTPRHSDGGRPMDLPVGVFRDKSLREAIQIYLQAGHRKQTNKEIALGLQKGGIASTSANFEATVATALGRMKDDGLVLRFPDGWDLASSYPDSLRNRLEKDTKPSKRGRSAKAVPKKKAAPAAKPAAPKGPGLDDRIQAFLESRPMEWFTSKEVADAIREQAGPAVSLAFARLGRYGRIARQDDGRYAAARKS